MSQNPGTSDLIREHLNLTLVLRRLEIFFDPSRCQGVWECYEVCPVGCWKPDFEHGVAIFQNAERCIACKACVIQCPMEAIELRVPGSN